MRTLPFFALLFFAVPLAEIWLLIKVGQVIGAFPTIFMVVLTAVIGAILLRQQGLSTFARFQQTVQAGQSPAKELLEGMILLVGGVLLMTPGFFTDALGLICLLPFTRRLLLNSLLRHAVVQAGSQTVHIFRGPFAHTPHARPPSQAPGREIEGEFERRDDKTDP